jgi:hypothetical protein
MSVVLHSHVALIVFIQSAIIYFFVHYNYLKDILWASDCRIGNALLQERHFSGPKLISEGAKTFWMPKNSITSGDTFMLYTKCKTDDQALSKI